MSLQEKIRADMMEAMKKKEEPTLTVLRGLLALFTNELTSGTHEGDTLSDDEVLALIRRSLKQRKDAATQFRAGGREDLAQKEDEEAKVLEVYLPQMMSKEEIEQVVKEKREMLGVQDKSGMGKLIGAVMADLKGKADGADVKSVVESLLQ